VFRACAWAVFFGILVYVGFQILEFGCMHSRNRYYQVEVEKDNQIEQLMGMLGE
jgi:hypothetical protein